MIWIAGGAAAIAGLIIGWAARGARNNSGETTTDWKTRLAARDHDLLEARDQLAAAAAESQAATARAHEATSTLAELRAEVESLRQHSEERDFEIERLEDLVIQLKATGGEGEALKDLVAARAEIARLRTELDEARSAVTGDNVAAVQDDLTRAHQTIAQLEEQLVQAETLGDGGDIPEDVASRLEELEVELASLQSQRCPEPDLHRSRPAPLVDSVIPDPGFSWASVSVEDDDAPLAPVVSLRPLGRSENVYLPPSVEEYEITPSALDLLADSPLFDESLYEDDDLGPSGRSGARSTSFEGKNGSAVTPAPQATDDLTEIKGIGPRIGSMLNRMGIRSFRDLAELGALEADELSQMFNGLASRLHRGNWIEVARELHESKYGETL